jgi:hypothetical protein
MPFKFANKIGTSDRAIKKSVKFFGRSIVLALLIFTASNYILRLPSYQFSFNILFSIQLIFGIYLFPFSFWIANTDKSVRSYFIIYVYLSGAFIPVLYLLTNIIDIYNLQNIIFGNAALCSDRTLDCLLKNYGVIKYQNYKEQSKLITTLAGFILILYVYTYIKRISHTPWYKILEAAIIWILLGKQLLEPTMIYIFETLHKNGF